MFYKGALSKINKGGFWNMLVIDGVVGAGKTTLMKILKEEGFVPFEEPVYNNPILEKFYYDRHRYSFPLQIFFLNKRFKHIKEASKVENAVMDRSIYGDVIFAKMLMESGEMSPEEFELYIELFENMIEHCHPPKLMVYLEISVDEAIRRINLRGRSYEKIVEREYWERLNRHYKEYFDQYSISPILKINVDNLDFENNLEHRQIVINKIKEYLKK
ncbi:MULTISPECIES: deoxynucleoside kinase [Caloramator]|uniref:Deoxyadenosine kinase / Deoxyguanosine kinase n=1 Tax=Caloramator australicus RC3 TaxID=857293 RepID=G0V495_9CLOT|nr:MULTISPECIES: deoxynucleoside kinase [Caloramator]WDU82112.1 deoxynucleoside kinase [Caloramator sp. Dgby_cultured_2]CCC57935.1 Deoxyadenosine kinase / Deoxyguanosine kinase [Caloramator australicus RC3]